MFPVMMEQPLFKLHTRRKSHELQSRKWTIPRRKEEIEFYSSRKYRGTIGPQRMSQCCVALIDVLTNSQQPSSDYARYERKYQASGWLFDQLK